jgi:hypothetical protein
VIRCLKRYVAHEIYAVLNQLNPNDPVKTT